MRRRRIVAEGFVARIDDEQQLHVRERVARERFIVNAHVEILAQALNDLLVSAIGFVPVFALGIVVAAVEQDGFGVRLGGNAGRTGHCFDSERQRQCSDKKICFHSVVEPVVHFCFKTALSSKIA